jgi:hypothetical protein
MNRWIGVKLTVSYLFSKLFIILASKSKIMKKILFILFVIGCIANSNAQVPSYVPTDGLVAYYPFNGNANDESGNGNNGTVFGSTELTNDRFDQVNSSYDFDLEEKSWGERNNEIYVPYSSQFNSNNLTVSAWVYPRSYFNPANPNDKNSRIITRAQYGYSSPNGQVWGLDFNDNRTRGFILAQGSNAAQGLAENRGIVTNNSPLTLNSWHHIIMTFDGENLKLYINNQLVANTSTTVVMNNVGTSGVSVGVSNQANGWWYDADAKIDDIGIWDRALSQQEVSNIYTSNSSNECSTLIINTGVLSTSPVTYTSTVNIYPNPANDQLTIDCGNLDNVDGWNIKITNMLGQEVFSEPMDTQQYVIPLNTWTGQGMYYVKIINAENKVVNIKKIILQ